MPSPKSSEIVYWHRRYLRQAEWTRELRLHLYRKVGLARCRRVLDLGCGTGVIAGEIAARSNAAVFGLDRDGPALGLAAGGNAAYVGWTWGEAAAMPFRSGPFDLIVTHYFWMWARDPEGILSECLRVLATGGILASLAEPEYSGGRDTPNQLKTIRDQLIKQLAGEGADPDAGPKVERLFGQAGLKTEAGVVEQGWGPQEHRREFRKEWRYVGKVLKGYKGLRGLEELERKAIEDGERASVMPVHWAVGRKP